MNRPISGRINPECPLFTLECQLQQEGRFPPERFGAKEARLLSGQEKRELIRDLPLLFSQLGIRGGADPAREPALLPILNEEGTLLPP